MRFRNRGLDVPRISRGSLCMTAAHSGHSDEFFFRNFGWQESHNDLPHVSHVLHSFASPMSSLRASFAINSALSDPRHSTEGREGLKVLSFRLLLRNDCSFIRLCFLAPVASRKLGL